MYSLVGRDSLPDVANPSIMYHAHKVVYVSVGRWWYRVDQIHRAGDYEGSSRVPKTSRGALLTGHGERKL